MGWKIAICDDDAGQAARLQSDVDGTGRTAPAP